jgi:uncharacterized membrane protein
VTTGQEHPAIATDRRIGRLLILLTYLSVGLLVVGVVALIVAGISPLDGGPAFNPATLVTDVLAMDPGGLLWLGLVAVIATPISRVVVAAFAYGRAGDWSMVGVALGILAVVAVGIAAAVTDTV